MAINICFKECDWSKYLMNIHKYNYQSNNTWTRILVFFLFSSCDHNVYNLIVTRLFNNDTFWDLVTSRLNISERPCIIYLEKRTVWKVPVFTVLLVRFFPHSDWIRSDILYRSPYSVQMRESTDQKNSEYGHFLRSNGYYPPKIQFVYIILCTAILTTKSFMIVPTRNVVHSLNWEAATRGVL